MRNPKVVLFTFLLTFVAFSHQRCAACATGCNSTGCQQLYIQPGCVGCIIAPTGSCTCTVTPIGHRCGTAVTQCGNCDNSKTPNCSDSSCCPKTPVGTYGVPVGDGGLRFPDKTLGYQYAAKVGWLHDATLKDQLATVSPYMSRAVEHLQQIAPTSTCQHLSGKLLNPSDPLNTPADMSIVVTHEGATVRVVDFETKSVEVLDVEGLRWTLYKDGPKVAEGYAKAVE